MKKKILLSTCGLLLAALTTATAADKTKVSYQEVSVHDPSIVVDGNTYYIFGSHLDAAKSTDMLNWTTFGGAQTDACTLFANSAGKQVGYADAYNSQVVKSVKNYKGETVTFNNFNAHDWQCAGSTILGNQWAPDVVYSKKAGKWFMYMSINADHWASAIVCLAADHIEGPYVYQGPVVCSGFQGRYDHVGYTKKDDWKHTDLAIATGATSLPERYNTNAWGSYWPNCIDPCVFYDENGVLRMTYGSWSGGIWEIQLDEATGLRDYTHTYAYQINGKDAEEGAADANTTSDPYFGKKIAGGYYVSGEGSFVRHIGDYYYLFLSYGGLTPNAGYVMRVFRSKNPEGPFVDGQDVSAVYSSYQLNYGDKSATNRGMKLMGAYGSWGSMATGERAQGHNSVYVDSDGDAFLVYHTKFDDGTYGHQVRVHPLFVNEDGWLVAAPFRYTGKQTTQHQIDNQRLFTADELAGTYQLLMHPYQQSCAYNDKVDASWSQSHEQKPQTVTLAADGTITGDVSGSWSYSQDGKSYITLTLDGWDYKGVKIVQNVDGYKDDPATCITATSFDGVPVWLYKEGATTAIRSISSEAVKAKKNIYNLAGQRVGKGYHGMVIRNGKKICL
ncbi:glycoside hydrolase family 43 protein [Prevotella sp. AGR2160]|uniref:glycoside hydrolase family 43 protein n=1 Tax=Prevotella sp. AGR2160 TaxID=1280674 RepID=UPI000411EF47|nr:glycoside hydrolase family 43 protein [Prevotella sp. AGR2160]